jgi:hypothetical protein
MVHLATTNPRLVLAVGERGGGGGRGRGGGPLRLVDMDKWVEMLESSGITQDADAARSPGLILLNMFQHMSREQGSVLLETKHTREKSMVMQSLKPVNQGWIHLWLEQWAI